MSLKEDDYRLIEDFIGDSLTDKNQVEFNRKKATSKEFNDLLHMQDEVLHDLTIDLYRPAERLEPIELYEMKPSYSESEKVPFDSIGIALMVISALGMLLFILLAVSLDTLGSGI